MPIQRSLLDIRHGVAIGLGLACLGACRGPGIPATRAYPRAPAAAADVEAPAQPPPAPPAADAVGRPTERDLRHAFAEAAVVDEPALALATFLADRERHGEALHVVGVALARGAGVALEVARAALLRDLGRRHEALAVLRDLADRGLELHPALRFETAELAWLEGDAEAARGVLAAMQSASEDAAWLAHAGSETHRVAEAIAASASVQRLRIRDVLGNLRGAPLPSDRMAALERLLAETGMPADARAVVHERTLHIALRDASAAVRARAVQRAPLADGLAADACCTGLADIDPLVRGAAASRAVDVLGSEAEAALLTALQHEPDASVFADLHRALRRRLPELPPLAPVAATSAAGRAEALVAVRDVTARTNRQP